MRKHVSRAAIVAVFVSSTALAQTTGTGPDNNQFKPNFSGKSENLPIGNNVEDAHSKTVWIGRVVGHLLAGDVDTAERASAATR